MKKKILLTVAFLIGMFCSFSSVDALTKLNFQEVSNGEVNTTFHFEEGFVGGIEVVLKINGDVNVKDFVFDDKINSSNYTKYWKENKTDKTLTIRVTSGGIGTSHNLLNVSKQLSLGKIVFSTSSKTNVDYSLENVSLSIVDNNWASKVVASSHMESGGKNNFVYTVTNVDPEPSNPSEGEQKPSEPSGGEEENPTDPSEGEQKPSEPSGGEEQNPTDPSEGEQKPSEPSGGEEQNPTNPSEEEQNPSNPGSEEDNKQDENHNTTDVNDKNSGNTNSNGGNSSNNNSNNNNTPTDEATGNEQEENPGDDDSNSTEEEKTNQGNSNSEEKKEEESKDVDWVPIIVAGVALVVVAGGLIIYIVKKRKEN